MAGRYRTDLVAVNPAGSRPAAWTFARQPVSGTEYTFEVIDENFRGRNQWEFVVRVPKSARERIEVRPLKVPNIAAWGGLDRRSLTFGRATRPNYRRYVYCPVALADPTGEKSRTVASDKAALPRWFRQLESRIHRKVTVASTRGTDADALVLHCLPSDYEFMIRAFFATKVWVLKDNFLSTAA